MTYKNKKMLLVEDNPDDEELALQALALNHMDGQIDIVHDGEEALDYLFATGKFAGQAHETAPDLILLDIKLPKIDGLEVLRRIRAHSRTRLAPVVFLTSSKEECDVLAGYELGANSYIQKPVDFTEFVSVVSQISSYWLQCNEAPPV